MNRETPNERWRPTGNNLACGRLSGRRCRAGDVVERMVSAVVGYWNIRAGCPARDRLAPRQGRVTAAGCAPCRLPCLSSVRNRHLREPRVLPIARPRCGRLSESCFALCRVVVVHLVSKRVTLVLGSAQDGRQNT